MDSMDDNNKCEAACDKHNERQGDVENHSYDGEDVENHDEENHENYDNYDEENDEENYNGDEFNEENSEGDDVVTDEEEEESESGWESSFHKFYNVYPLSYIEKTHLEVGNKIIMPQSALEELMDEGVGFPMLFKIENQSKGKTSHCGVIEFSAEEGVVFMPNWMMNNMLLESGDLINLKNVDLDRATYVKLQPHSSEFLDIVSPKDVLESAFCLGYACLTVGDTIVIMHEGKTLYVDIVEALPSNAVCVIQTDVEVDFACPLDYKEPAKPIPEPELPKKDQKLPEKEQELPKFVPFTGRGRRLDETKNETNEELAAVVMSNSLVKPSEAVLETSKNFNTGQPFKPFTGKKYSLMD